MTTHIDEQGEGPPGRRWRERAACREIDPELFFPAAESGPARTRQVAAAKAVCARCPVREQCLTEALARIPYGIAGGLTEHERRRLRRNQHIASATSTGTGTGRVAATAGELGEVWAGGPRDGWSKTQRAGTGRALLAAGRPIPLVAQACGVSTRTVQRWATSNSTKSSNTSATREGSRGGNRAPLGPPTPTNPWQGPQQRKESNCNEH